MPKQEQDSGMLMKVVLLLVVVLVLVVAFVGYRVIKGDEVPSFEVAEGTQLSEEQIGDLLGRISRLIQLPEEKNPLIATINDAAALRAEQAFYRDAENGDQLVIFAERAMAVIYRPSADKLINVGPIFFDNAAQPQPQPQAIETAPVVPTEALPL
jgi:hypothetical protein